MEGVPLRVRVLGGLSVDGIEEHELGSRKARTLLKILILARRRPVAVDRLVEALWGDAPPSAPSEQVGVLVSRLRRVLGADRLPRTDAGYSLAVDWLDVDELEARVGEARDARAAGRLAAARSAADASINLVLGDVLPEEDGEWVLADRAHAAAVAADARRILAEAAGQAGDHTAAAAAAEVALAADPYDEASLRILMRAHVGLGRPASALAAYGRVKERLGEDLGMPPAHETEELHDAIVLGDDVRSAEQGTVDGLLPAPLAGRHDEFVALDSAFERCRTLRTAGIVLVEGETGIGKTTLLDAWLARIGRDAQVLVGRARELGRDLPLQPITDAFSAYLAALGADDRAELLGGNQAAVLEPVLGLAGPTPARASTIIADVEIERARLFAALRAVLGRIASARPTVLAVDDLHHAGPSTAAWLDFAAGLDAPVLLLATTRPTSAVSGLAGVRRIAVGPLDVAAVAALVGTAVTPELASDLHARTGGNPLLLTALVHDPTETSTTLAAAVARRTRALGDAETTVRTAAVLGGDVDLDLLAGVTQTPASLLLEHLERGAAAGLLVERGAGFSFRHDLERGELELSTGTARRALIHRDAARALAARPDPDPLAVADHARLGGDSALAVDWYIRAADVAVARADTETADAILSTALDLADTADARVARARVRIVAGRLDEAAEDASRALTARRDPSGLEVAGWVSYYQRRSEQAGAYADEAVERAADPALRASCLALAGRVRHASGDLAGGVAALESAIDEHAPPRAASLARVWLGWARLHQGAPGNALALVPPVLDGMPHPFAPFHARLVKSVALGHLGRVSEALAVCDEFDEVASRSGPSGARFLSVASNCRAWLLRWTGRLDEADEYNERALAQIAALGMEEARYAALLDLADGRVLAGDYDAAAHAVARMAPIEEWDGTMAWHQRHRYSLLRARLALVEGDRDSAAALADAVATDAAGRGAGRYELRARALAALAGGRDGAQPARLEHVVLGLKEGAVLDGWALVGSLAAQLGVAKWRHAADELIARLVKASPEPDAVVALAARVLGR